MTIDTVCVSDVKGETKQGPAVPHDRPLRCSRNARAGPVVARARRSGQGLGCVQCALRSLCHDDLYVFVISISDKLVRANGADPRLIGIDTDALSLRAPGGKFVQEMIAAAGRRDQRAMDYAWPNPVAGNVENKHVFLRKVDDMVIGVGSYAR